MGIFKEDGVTRNEVEQIVDTFPGQSIDFFGALRARVYDDAVRAFVKEIGTENMGARLVNSKDGKVRTPKIVLLYRAVKLDVLICTLPMTPP